MRHRNCGGRQRERPTVHGARPAHLATLASDSPGSVVVLSNTAEDVDRADEEAQELRDSQKPMQANGSQKLRPWGFLHYEASPVSCTP